MAATNGNIGVATREFRDSSMRDAVKSGLEVVWGCRYCNEITDTGRPAILLCIFYLIILLSTCSVSNGRRKVKLPDIENLCHRFSLVDS